MSGRMLFKYDPTLFKDDENALDAQMYDVVEQEEEEEKENVDEALFQAEGAQ